MNDEDYVSTDGHEPEEDYNFLFCPCAWCCGPAIDDEEDPLEWGDEVEDSLNEDCTNYPW